MKVVSGDSSSKKNWLILVVALVLGGSAAWLSSYYLDFKEAEIRNTLAGSNTKKIPVVVPKYQVGPGDIIDSSNMVVREIPSQYVPDGAFTPKQFKSLIGRVVTADISAGKPVLKNSIAGVGIKQFSDLLTEGQRAITIPMDEFNSTAGMLVAGDRIDLYLLADKKTITGFKSKEKSSALYLVLENAVVLATGRSTLEDMVIKSNSMQASDFDQYNTITLGIPLRDAGRLGLARQDGKFVAMLRNREDDKRVKHRLLDSNDVYMNVAKIEHKVEYIIGGSAKKGIASVAEQAVEMKKLARKLGQIDELINPDKK
ncbi:MAG: Flp pilus assembly protein CpaB [Kangiellaceae bacterium]|nr:Flp pilus assembly protein CpaB [Kangiellaceae bacterium]